MTALAYRRGVVLVLLAIAGCAGDDAASGPPFDRTDGGAAIDASEGVSDGGAGADAAGPGLDGGLPAFTADSGGFLGGGGEPDASERDTCYDQVDNDDDGVVDCAEPSCQLLRSCCIGSGACCGTPEATALPATVAFAGCDPAAGVDACLDGQGVDGTPFGSPAPRLDAQGLAPGGDASFDSGVVLGDPVDLRARRVVIEAQLVPASGCGASCLEGLGVGLSTRATFDDATTVAPAVGVTYAGSRDEVAFVVAGEVVGQAPFPGDGTVRIEAEPGGTVRGYVGAGSTEPVAQAAFVPPAAARLVVYGRNRDGMDGARVASLEVGEDQCDMPAAWKERTAITIVDPASGMEAALGPVGSPSLAYDGDGVAWIAFEEARETGDVIRWARRTGGDAGTFELVDATGAAAVEPGLGEDHVRDPELVWNAPAGGWVLLHTVVGSDGSTWIGRATAGEGDVVLTRDPEPLVVPADANADALTDPTVARRDDGRWAILIATRSDAAAEWAVLTADSESDLRDPVLLDQVSPVEAGALDRSGRDLTEPSLVNHSGAWRIVYARTGGTRPSIAGIASDEMLFFRSLTGGRALFEGSGTGFDKLGVLAPDVLARDDAIEMVYLGFDGIRRTLGITQRQAHPLGTF